MKKFGLIVCLLISLSLIIISCGKDIPETDPPGRGNPVPTGPTGPAGG